MKKDWKHYKKDEAIAILKATHEKQLKESGTFLLDSFEFKAVISKNFSSKFYNRLLEKYSLV